MSKDIIEFGWGCLPDPYGDEERETEQIILLGGDDDNSLNMLDNLRKAILELDSDSSIKYTDNKALMSYYGVMTLPAFIVNDKLMSYGKVLDTETIVNILKDNL